MNRHIEAHTSDSNPHPLDYVSKNDPQLVRPRPILRWWIVPATLLFAAIAFHLLMSPSRSRDFDAYHVQCASNLRQIGLGILLYANTHNGHFPDSFSDLLADPAIDLTPEVFVCPNSHETSACAPTTQQWAARLTSEP